MKAFVSLIAAVALMISVGCGKTEEAPVASQPAPTPSSNAAPPVSTNLPDFSTDDRVKATVIPTLIEKFGAEPTLAGVSLNVELKDRTLHIMGDVKSNDQKRKIDEIVKTLEPAASAAGYKFMNMAIVKG